MLDSRFEAVLWDLDGVIADTKVYHFRAWQELFEGKGLNFTEEQFRDYFGRRNDTIARDILGNDISRDELTIIIAEKEGYFRRNIANRIEALPGALALIRALKEGKIKMALASSSDPDNLRLVIQGLGIEDYFQAVAYGKEVTEGKPSPEVFLLAAKKLGVSPRDCVVIEDAVAGVTGAKRAGMKCVAVANSHPAASLQEADLVVDSLETVRISDLAGLFKQTK